MVIIITSSTLKRIIYRLRLSQKNSISMSLNPLMLEDFVLEGSPVAWMIGRVIQMLEESKTNPYLLTFSKKRWKGFLNLPMYLSKRDLTNEQVEVDHATTRSKPVLLLKQLSNSNLWQGQEQPKNSPTITSPVPRNKNPPLVQKNPQPNYSEIFL